ncbi:MAG: ABC transporter permease [Candidatus Riflebacteria bacterium]|nr:ABC transporter permease [Candidatus Riflebacteria bacterium]
MSAMISAVTLLIFNLGMNDGLIWGIINNSTETMFGHLTVTEVTYIDQPSLYKTIPEDVNFRKTILKNPEVKGICGRISCFVLLSFGNDENSHSQAVELLGINPDEEIQTSRLPTSVTKGKFLSSNEAHEIILGENLAKRLEATIGGQVAIMGQAADGSICSDLLTVAGFMKTGNSFRDSSLALTGRKTLQEILVLDNKLHKWIVFLKNPLKSNFMAETLKKDFPSFLFTTWQKLVPQMASILDILTAIQLIVMGIFYFAVFLITMNTMNMAFLERRREFAILGAIGLTKKRLAVLITLEGCLLGIFAGIFGGVLGTSLSFWFHYYPLDLSAFLPNISYGEGALQPFLTCNPTLKNVFSPILGMLILGNIVACLPIIRLIRQKPAEALRNS